MNGPIRIEAVAARAGVHKSTVSRALNPATSEMVSEETRARVIAAAQELGFSVSLTARSLSTGRSMTIGVLILDIANPVSAAIIRGIDDTLHKAGYGALIGNTDGDPERSKELLRRFRDRGVDGLIVGTALLDDDLLAKTAVGDTAVVQMNRRSSSTTLPTVQVDSATGTREALTWLKKNGHREIGYVTAPPNTSTGQDRLHDFRAAYRKLFKREPAVWRFADGATYEAGYAKCQEMLDGAPQLTALMATSDLMALGCIDAIRSRGLSCPGDISVIGFDDMPLADHFSPPLSTIRFDHYGMGVKSAELLLAQLNGTLRVGDTVNMSTEWIPRGSTAPARG